MKSWMLGQIADLLQKLPGVKVLDIRASGNRCMIEASIVQFESLSRLAHCAAGADVRSDIRILSSSVRNVDFSDPASLVYRFESLGEMRRLLSSMEEFCILLADMLGECNLLDPKEANALINRIRQE